MLRFIAYLLYIQRMLTLISILFSSHEDIWWRYSYFVAIRGLTLVPLSTMTMIDMQIFWPNELIFFSSNVTTKHLNISLFLYGVVYNICGTPIANTFSQLVSPSGTNCAPLMACLVLYCNFVFRLTQRDIIEASPWYSEHWYITSIR